MSGGRVYKACSASPLLLTSLRLVTANRYCSGRITRDSEKALGSDGAEDQSQDTAFWGITPDKSSCGPGLPNMVVS